MAFPYYRFFPGDYARDTRRLTLLQHGAYRLLIDEYMMAGGLRGDVHAICRICLAFSGEEKAAVEYVLAEFFVRDGPEWKNSRCDRELGYLAGKTEAARGSALHRWSERNANALRTQYEGNANQNQNQNQNQKTKTRKANPTAPLAPRGVTPSVWEEWVAYKGRKLTPAAYAKQRKFLEAQPDADACIEQSIRNTWTGLFALETRHAGDQRNRRRLETIAGLTGGLSGTKRTPGKTD